MMDRCKGEENTETKSLIVDERIGDGKSSESGEDFKKDGRYLDWYRGIDVWDRKKDTELWNSFEIFEYFSDGGSDSLSMEREILFHGMKWILHLPTGMKYRDTRNLGIRDLIGNELKTQMKVPKF